MSLSMNRTANVKVLDPLTNVNEKQYFAILKGGKETVVREIPSTTFSNSSAQFSNPPPSPGVIMDRRVMLKQPVTVTISGDSNNAARGIIQSGQDAFRSYPLASIMTTLDISINGQNTSLNLNDLIKPLLLYHNNARNLSQRENSLSPAQLDIAQTYAELDGSVRNPLASAFDSNQDDNEGRGSFPYTTLVNTQFSATVEATLTEELFLSPLVFGGPQDYSGFIGVQNFIVNITWDGQLNRIWSHSSASSSTISSITVVLGQPSLLYRYITPSMLEPIPRSVEYQYNDIQRYPTDLNQSVASDAFITLSSTNIQLNAIPRYVYIYARKRNQDLTFNDTDSYFSLRKINVNWANNSGLLSDSSQEQLYDISRKNGVNLSWTDWSGLNNFNYLGNTITRLNGIGSVLSLEWGTDIGLQEDECPGLLGTYQLQIRGDFQNVSPNAINPTLYIVVITPGVFTIENNTARKQIGVINREDIINARQISGIDYYDLKMNLMSGGINIKKIARKALKYGLPLLETLIPQTAPLEKYIPLLEGAGITEYWKMYAKNKRKFPNLSTIRLRKMTSNQYGTKPKRKAIAPRKRCPKGKRKTPTKYVCRKKGKSLVGGNPAPVGAGHYGMARDLLGGEMISKRQLMKRLQYY